MQIGFKTSLHDLETKAKQADKFLKRGDKVKLNMPLRGREKAFGNLAREKVGQFCNMLDQLTPIKVEREIKREFYNLYQLDPDKADNEKGYNDFKEWKRRQSRLYKYIGC